MGKFGLGRGLADLQAEMGNMPDISILSGTERVVVKQIPLVQISTNPDQPRKTFSDTELADLAASIKEKGVLQPILLRSVTERPYSYEIVAGERRFRASKLAGLDSIPALIKTLSNENAMEIALIENVQRENLNPIEEGAAYKNIMEKCGYELADVSRLIGKSESYIRNIMSLDKLPTDVKNMIEQGTISASHGRYLSVAERPSELAQQIVQNKLSVEETGKLVKNAPRSSNSRAFVSKTISPDILVEMQAKIKKILGTTAKIKEKRGGAGEIVLHFASRIQLQEIINKISRNN